jgi:nitrile hydratase
MEKIHWPLQLPRLLRVFRMLGRALTSHRVTSAQIDIQRRVDQNVAIIRGSDSEPFSRGKRMTTTRRDFLTTAAATAGAAMTPELTPEHHHEHGHDHEHQVVPSDPTLRVKALESLLVEKGIVDRAALDALVDTYENKIGPRNGARIVARAWVDPAYKARLLADANDAMADFGFLSRQGDRMVVVENTPKVHNLIVCTLCSCYPWPVLGLPPVWYKSAPYRSRAVIDPRGVLREFGVQFAEDVEVRVWDSTAELRYLVLPERPEGTERMSEDELAVLVTRDSMVGVVKVLPPSKARS